jgi:hypothetical protein
MVRVTSLLLQIAVTASVANAQLGGFFKNAFGGAIAQVPLVKQAQETVVAAKSHQLTSENWKSSINVTIDENASEEDIQEWLLYFTTHPTNGTAQRNVTYWDAVYNVCYPASHCIETVETIETSCTRRTSKKLLTS